MRRRCLHPAGPMGGSATAIGSSTMPSPAAKEVSTSNTATTAAAPASAQTFNNLQYSTQTAPRLPVAPGKRRAAHMVRGGGTTERCAPQDLLELAGSGTGTLALKGAQGNCGSSPEQHPQLGLVHGRRLNAAAMPTQAFMTEQCLRKKWGLFLLGGRCVLTGRCAGGGSAPGREGVLARETEWRALTNRVYTGAHAH